MLDGLLRWWRRTLPLETTLLAGFLWLCALPLITTLALPRLGGLVAALLALAALLAAGMAAVAIAGPVFRPASAATRDCAVSDDLHEDHRYTTWMLHRERPYSLRMMQASEGRRQQ